MIQLKDKYCPVVRPDYKKIQPLIHCLGKAHLKYKDIARLNVKGWTEMDQANNN